MFFDVSVTGDKSHIYINPCNNSAIMSSDTVRKAVNFEKVNFEGVNNLAVCFESDGSFRIFQAAGYTMDRGLFCDMY